MSTSRGSVCSAHIFMVRFPRRCSAPASLWIRERAALYRSALRHIRSKSACSAATATHCQLARVEERPQRGYGELPRAYHKGGPACILLLGYLSAHRTQPGAVDTSTGWAKMPSGSSAATWSSSERSPLLCAAAKSPAAGAAPLLPAPEVRAAAGAGAAVAVGTAWAAAPLVALGFASVGPSFWAALASTSMGVAAVGAPG
eukprot:scaffold3587_cov364-Prasinococcus_capsulatus_cf.AAC.5